MIFIASAVVLLLVVLNGLFAMSELAVVSSRRTKLQAKADRGERGAQLALRLADEPTRFLSAVQVGITLIGILSGAYGQATIAGELGDRLAGVPALSPWAEEIATGLVVVVITYLSLIVGELVPKRLALIHPEAIASLVAQPLSFLARLMGPFVTLLTASTAAVLRMLRVRDKDGSSITQEEVETVLAEGTGAGLIEPQEQAMMNEVMRLGDRVARVAMTPRHDLYWVSLADDDDQIREDIRSCPYSRFVVSAGADFGAALGVVHKRDVADALLSGEPLDLRALARDPLYVPETASLLAVLDQLKSSPTHMAFVVDEFGALEGVITPTDILEMIAGDFPETHDSGEVLIRAWEDGTFLVDGKADLVDLNGVLGASFETASNFHTVGGLVLNRLGRFPEEGEVLRFGEFDVEIIDMDERRIDKVLFRPAR
jgi:putative hemolysin